MSELGIWTTRLLATHRAPVNFKAPARPMAALPDRILSALRLRAMSARRWPLS